MGTKKDIGTVFKETMSNYSATPDGVWLNIEAQLKRNQRRKFFLLFLLFFIVLVPTGFFVYQNQTSTPESVENTKTILESPKKDKNTIDPETEIKNPTPSLDVKTNTPTQLKNQVAEEKIKVIKEEDSIKPKNFSQKEDEDTNTVKETTSKEKRDIQKAISLNSKISNDSILNSLDTVAEVTRKENKKTVSKPKPLEEDIEDDDGNTFMRWSAQPVISLDYYGAFNRQTSQRFTFNEGIYLQYRGTKKMAFRIGYKELNLQYNFQSLTSKNQQKVSYTEIPLEIKYSFESNYLIKPSIITGASYLFLNNASILNMDNNSIRLNKGDFRGQMFSLNIGLGLQYQINKRWNVNIESIFKYHPYPYTKSVGFYPYNISVSAGIEYNFKF